MRRRLVMLIMLLMLGGWLLGFDPAPAHACSCVESPPPAIALQNSAVVFAGEVLSINQKGFNLFGEKYVEYPVRVTFRITEFWKGVNAERLTVLTSMSSCGFDFDAGKQYLVYAYESPEGLATGLCTRTAELAKASGDLAVLGNGTVPPPSPEPIRSSPAGMALFWAGTVLSVFAAIVLVLLMLRLRRRQ